MRPNSHKNLNKKALIKVFIYRVVNKINGKGYIGITYNSIDTRWKQHLYEANGLKKRRIFYSAIRKYGAENFEISLIKISNSWNEACYLEKKFIKDYNTYHETGHGYNMTTGGDGVIGYKPTKDEIARTIAGIKRSALERNEFLRPAIEQLMKRGFVNFSDFASRLNTAGVPTLKGSGNWGIIKVKNLLRTLGYNMNELESIALSDKVNLRHVKATIEKSHSFYRSIEHAVKKIMSEYPDSLRHVIAKLEKNNVPCPSGKKWHKITTKKMLKYLGYDVNELIKRGTNKINKPRKVVVAGFLYDSVNKAEKATGNKHISRDIKCGRKGYYYFDEGQLPKPRRKKRRPPTKVSINGVIFNHAADAGKSFRFKPDTITNRCYSLNFPDHFFCDENGKKIILNK